MEKKRTQTRKIDKKIVKETEGLMKELMDHFGIEAETTVEPGSYINLEDEKEEFVDVKISGEDIGVLIGYMGRNLRSLQKIVGLLINRRMKVDSEEPSYIRVVMDVSGYREKRQDTLERMAERIREEVLVSGEAEDLSSMTSFERRVIHSRLGEFDDVTTESFGEGERRFVRVFPIGDGEEESSADEVDSDDLPGEESKEDLEEGPEEDTKEKKK